MRALGCRVMGRDRGRTLGRRRTCMLVPDVLGDMAAPSNSWFPLHISLVFDTVTLSVLPICA